MRVGRWRCATLVHSCPVLHVSWRRLSKIPKHWCWFWASERGAQVHAAHWYISWKTTQIYTTDLLYCSIHCIPHTVVWYSKIWRKISPHLTDQGYSACASTWCAAEWHSSAVQKAKVRWWDHKCLLQLLAGSEGPGRMFQSWPKAGGTESEGCMFPVWHVSCTLGDQIVPQEWAPLHSYSENHLGLPWHCTGENICYDVITHNT